jgi:flagellar hook protein FlgE
MSFLRSLFAGVSGLRSHQVMMDVLGNNISNVNTIGFKSGRVTFGELFAQTLRSATQPTVGSNGGTNPMQVGLGTSVNSLDTLFSQGGIENTGQNTDLALQGPGFFAVKKNGQTFYTRVGTFRFDANGTLVNPGNGAILQGKLADLQGNIPAGTTLQDLTIPLDRKSPPNATTGFVSAVTWIPRLRTRA